MYYFEEDYLAPTSEVLYEAYGPSSVDNFPYSEKDGQDDCVRDELELATGCRPFIDGPYCFLEEAA